MSAPPPRPSRLAALRPLAAGVAAAALTLLAVAGAYRVLAPAPVPAANASAEVAPSAVPTPAAPAVAPPLPEPKRNPVVRRLSVLTVRLARNQTLAQALARLQLAPGQAQGILKALADKFPFHRSRPGDQLRVERVEGEESLHRFTYRQSAAEEWIVAPAEDGALRGEKRAVAMTTEVARVEVPIRGSLWESVQAAGEEPALAVIASDVLAWDVDFYQDIRAGDRLTLLVEKITADGRLLRYGDVLAASYEGSATGRKRLFRYTDGQGFTSNYDEQGNSARRGFLRSPLPYAHVTSGFGSRLHPLLGYVRSHQGVDYGAPVGTPVWAVGDGTVAQAGWNGGCGRAVTLRHRNGYDTIYCHLSAVNVRAGARVSQKQVIGLVGQTGLATGPHLHYAVKHGDTYVNPQSLKVPREAPIAPQQRASFEEKVAPLRARLDAAPVA